MEQDYNTKQYNDSFKQFDEACELIRKKYRIAIALTKEEAEKFRGAKEGDLVTRNPDIPNNPVQAFEIFINYYASIQFELQKHLFIEKYKIINEGSIVAELKELENWIEEALKESYSKACENPYSNNNKHEYLRLANRFYNGFLMTWEHHNESSLAASIYGRYFLFYSYLKKTLSATQEQRTSIIDIIKKQFPDLLDIIELTSEQWFNNSYNARKSLFKDVSIKEHCERELLVQRNALEKDVERSLNHKNYEIRLAFLTIAKNREAFIKYLEEKLEEVSYPEVPSINKLIYSNLNICDTVLDAYYSIVPQLSDDESVPENFIGKRHRFNAPFHMKVYDAWVLSKDWEHLQLQRKEKITPYDSVSDKEVEAALNNYGNGFKKGYFKFEKELLSEESASIVIKNSNCARIVFDYVTGSFLGRGGYPISFGEGNYFKNWYETGIEAGRYYRAWYIILEYYFVFEPLFVSHYHRNASTVNPVEKNDFTLSTIEDYLEDFYKSNAINQKDYNNVKQILLSYFKDGRTPEKKAPVFIRNGNKKKLAYACGKIFRSLKNEPLSYGYLLLLKNTFEVYANEEIEENKANKSNLYKYCTNKNQ